MKAIFEFISSKRVCLKATFDAGSNVEFGGNFTPGIAHFCEHMVFLGTKDLSPDELNRQMATLGADWNAGTYHDKVCFYIIVPVENAFKAAELLKKVLFDGQFNNESFEKERDVVLEEERGGRDDIDSCVYESLNIFLCNGPYSAPIIGTEESIKAITLDELRKFHKNYYRPERLLLTITGPNELDINTIISVFGDNDGEFKRSRKVKTTFKNEKIQVIKDDRIQQARAFVCYKSCNIGDSNSLSLNYANKFFADDMDSRLFQKIRQERGLCYAVGGYLSFYREVGWYMLWIRTAQKNVEEAINLMDQEVALLLKNGPTDEEMIRAKNKYKSEIYSITETSYGLNAILNGRSYYNLPDLNVSINRINNMSKEEINVSCKKTFKSKNRQVFLYLPGDNSEVQQDEE
ncbi:MAG: pitrilysin family protein [Patescibacteria group bacterium]|jgi:predicted Zn-dependent peptidase